MSLPEAMLWKRLRGSQTGLRFRRQHPTGPYVVDFYCAPARLVIEVDGVVHDRAERPARDEHRDRFMQENGYGVWRVAAADILRNADIVVRGIVSRAASPLHHASHGPPPRAGED